MMSIENLDSARRSLQAHLNSNLNEKKVVDLLNLLQDKDDGELIRVCEDRISKMLSAASGPANFQETLDYLRQNLRRPLSLQLAGDITDERLECLKGLPIQNLWLSSPSLTRMCFLTLAEIPSLKTLRIGAVTWLDDKALETLPRQVENLELTFCKNFSREGLRSLQNASLRSLYLSGCTQLGDADLQHLPTSCERIELWQQNVGVETMKRLGSLPKLRTLVLASKIDDSLMQHLSRNLASLQLINCNVSDAGLKKVAEMSHLTDFRVSSLEVTDSSLALLPLSLVSLSFNGCSEISDAGVLPLAHRMKLRELTLHRCSKVTFQAIEKFRGTPIKLWGQLWGQAWHSGI